MANALIQKIREFAHAQGQISYAPASSALVEKTVASLAFDIPALLKACYLEVANGGFGPGYGLIGMEGGAQSDFGTLVETYNQLKGDKESEGDQWQDAVLPFCDWGCNIFTCLDCASDGQPTVYTFEDFEIWPQDYTLEQFFEMWMNGADILAYERVEKDKIEMKNPFTGDQETISKRRRS